MARIGRQGRLWLRGFHFFFFGSWIGSQICSNMVFFAAGSASDGIAFHAYHANALLLDFMVTIPCAVLTLITGLLLCWLTTWGFFKNGWVIYSLVAAIVVMMVGAIWLAPGKVELLAISEREGLTALQSPAYTSTWNTVAVLNVLVTIITTSAVFISAFKPWRKRAGAEATS
jgi:uncharacterized membrane protein